MTRLWRRRTFTIRSSSARRSSLIQEFGEKKGEGKAAEHAENGGEAEDRTLHGFYQNCSFICPVLPLVHFLLHQEARKLEI